MLIAFEGQDGAGKTSLLEAVRRQLERESIPVVTVSEFSDSPYGIRLLDALTRDKFLRPVADEATSLTRALDIVADLYYLDEHFIDPALADGVVVLKDRHVHTIFTTQVPALTAAGAIGSESRALTWLSVLMSELRHKPNLTVYVDAPLEVRLDRIKNRTRNVAEARAEKIGSDDLAIFAERERLMRLLINEEPERFLIVNNGSRPLDEGVKEVVSRISAQQPSES